MDLFKAIEELRAEKRRLDEIIARLEDLATGRGVTGQSTTKRGRKSMSEAERVEVSQRMKAYWAKRRKSSAAGA
jgi:hypothetical protein